MGSEAAVVSTSVKVRPELLILYLTLIGVEVGPASLQFTTRLPDPNTAETLVTGAHTAPEQLAVIPQSLPCRSALASICLSIRSASSESVIFAQAPPTVPNTPSPLINV